MKGHRPPFFPFSAFYIILSLKFPVFSKRGWALFVLFPQRSEGFHIGSSKEASQ
jgi:hypothetical protein